MVPSPNAETASFPSPEMVTPQATPGAGVHHCDLPVVSKRRTYHSEPSRKDCLSGATAKLREVSYRESGSAFPFSFGVFLFFQSVSSRPSVTGGTAPCSGGIGPGWRLRFGRENQPGDC